VLKQIRLRKKLLRQQIGVRRSIGEAVQAGTGGLARLAVFAEDFRPRRCEQFFA
jgi:hypothetical protein